MKKHISLFLSAALAAGALTGCGQAETAAAPVQADKPLRIVATTFPQYDWVRQILGERADSAELTLLQDDGVDLHSFQPTADDMVTIANCDLFLYTGGESDEWVGDALQNAANPDRVTLNLMELLGDRVKTEQTVDGMQVEAHDHDHAEDKEDAHEQPEQDEHIWLSLRNAAVLCRGIADKLCALDPAGQAQYEQNVAAYTAKLNELDGRYQAAVDAASGRTLLFADRFPFRYLVDDYGLSYYAAFAGCSAETEASFETVAFLAGKVDELKLPCVLAIEGAAHSVADTVVRTAKSGSKPVLTMDSMQSVTAVRVQQGETYLSVMERNLETLRTALQ